VIDWRIGAVMQTYVRHIKEMLRASRNNEEVPLRRAMALAWLFLAFVCPFLAVVEIAITLDKRIAIGTLLGLYPGWVVCQYFINRFRNERAFLFANVVEAGDPNDSGSLFDFFAVLCVVVALSFFVLIPMVG